ncbi:Hypothetical predicted protein [Pelobates cultripes]|uniref:Uncharacterized protein n=1 Tax=Pelobates cultripes TaxID=61616 RepID=A0AAD1WET6_PELCU|nr:Hypothetical predicted protein [Pelobates cultripes]
MRKACMERTWRQAIEIYNNLSHLTLQAWRTPRYAIDGNTEATIRTPQDDQAFQEALDLPRIPIPDWMECPVNERFTGMPTRRTIQQGPGAPYAPLRQTKPEE